jgi:thiol-disulfide isomerase/thioredoxin/tetratricopeptide (TPR) repeat protein
VDSTEPTAAADTKSPGTQAPQASQKEHGFLVNAPDEALAQAKREGKPLMIDFFGIWCPPCNELDEKVFSTLKFSQSASRFVRLKLDADAQVSWKMKSQYQVGGYPTIVFASPEGDEISRIVGSRPLPDFLREMDVAWNQRTSPLELLEKKAQAGDRDAADRAGVIRFNRGDIEDAEKLLKGTKKKREIWHLVEIQMLEDKGSPTDQRISRLDSAIAEFPKTPNTVTWYENLAKLYGERKEEAKKKAALQQAIDLALSLSKNPARMKGYDATAADLLEQEASDREDLDGQQAARKDWLAAAHAYGLQGLGDKERANNLEYAFCLGKAGELEKARAIYQRLEHAYPNEFTFYFGHARMESDHGGYAAALPLANQALQYSYGDNRLRAVLLVAKIHEALGEKDKSRAVLDETLKDIQLPQDEKVRTHRYAKAIQDMRAKLN